MNENNRKTTTNRNYARLIDALQVDEWLIAKEISYRVNNAKSRGRSGRGGKELNAAACATLLRTMTLHGLIQRKPSSPGSETSRFCYRRFPDA